MALVTFFRGTTELWERQAMLHYRLVSARHLAGLQTGNASLKPRPFNELSYDEIDREIVNRVGVETAQGTSNKSSHFVPMGTNRDIASNFGKGDCFVFLVDCILILAQDAAGIRNTMRQGPVIWNRLWRGSVPVFKGGNAEFLAYTGTELVSVDQLHPDQETPDRYTRYYISKVTNGALTDCCGDIAPCGCRYATPVRHSVPTPGRQPRREWCPGCNIL